jgi:predicted DCC family thiol-disulfide oxidoreductase YuxK
MSAPSKTASQDPILFFDGFCHLCTTSVTFVLRHERDPLLRFAPLDGPLAKKELKVQLRSFPDSLILMQGGKIYTRSDAALRLAAYLRAPYRFASYLLWMPAVIRNFGYDLIARYRYRLFGKHETCMLPSKEIAHRFMK